MRFWVRKDIQKWQSVVLTVKNVNSQWNKSGLGYRYLVYECNNRISDLHCLLPTVLSLIGFNKALITLSGLLPLILNVSDFLVDGS